MILCTHQKKSKLLTDNTKVRAVGEVSCAMRISGGISGLIADGWHSSDSFILSQPSVAWTIGQISSAGGFSRSRFAAGMRTPPVKMDSVATAQKE